MGELLPLVYAQLHALAAHYFRRERRDHTLQPTALVHEAYMRLAGQQRDWENRQQFFGIAALMMRRVLVDHARAHAAEKRPQYSLRVSIADDLVVSENRVEEILAVDEALTRLAALDPQQAHLVELRYFAGYSLEEAAEALHMTHVTAKRRWNSARAWLHRQLASNEFRAVAKG